MQLTDAQPRESDPMPASAERLAEAFSALASEVRLRILRAIADRALECRNEASCDLSERCCTVSELAVQAGVDLSTASRHLKELRRAGFLLRRRSGRQVFYELDRSTFDRLVDTLDRFGSPAPAEGTGPQRSSGASCRNARPNVPP